jgi:mRNA interferase HicA
LPPPAADEAPRLGFAGIEVNFFTFPPSPSTIRGMKRRDVVAHLQKYGCRLLREGASHSVFMNGGTRATSTVPRHREIKDMLVRKICGDLGIPVP